MALTNDRINSLSFNLIVRCTRKNDDGGDDDDSSTAALITEAYLVTLGTKYPHRSPMSSLSTSQTLSDDLADYDVISENGSRSLESSIADLNTYDPSEELEFPSDPHTRNSSNIASHAVPSTAQNTVRGRERDSNSTPLNFRVSPGRSNWEPEPLQPAKDRFETARLTPDQIQDYVRKSLEESHSLPPIYGHGQVLVEKMGTVRVYVDGLFDGLNVAYVPLPHYQLLRI